MTPGRRLLLALTVLLGVAATLVVPANGPPDVAVVTAADNDQFRAGSIITDQLFFDGSAMAAGQVQQFLDAKNPRCTAGPDGTPCLRTYRQSTWTRTGDAQCGTYTGAAGETAATIIAKVGKACSVSQRALLVILQKEQGLVTASGPSLYADRYRKAMGYGCPDTAPCDAQYYGFYNQVYSAAYRYRFYAANPTRYNHRAGQVNQVRFHPDAACGSSSVFIVNQATAGLYNYTPYQPNQAALAAGAGEGDGCSAYGNRNFWRYFTDWFGSTQTAGGGDLVNFYLATGGQQGPLGAVSTPVTCGLVGGGCTQSYVNGSIWWSPETKAKSMQGAVEDFWSATGAAGGPLGYPTRSVSWAPDRVGQFATFQRGSIWWSPETGARSMQGAIGVHYANTGGAAGPLGYPTKSVSWAPDGVGQFAVFEGGSVWWSPTTGARTMFKEVGAHWSNTGGVRGPLGYPTSSVSWAPDGVGQYATFEGGSVYWSPSTGARTMFNEVGAHWSNTGGVTGPLGYPTRSVSWLPDRIGQYATFQGGSVYWSPDTGARTMMGHIEDVWQARGAQDGDLGYPTSSVLAAADGASTYASFENGTLWSDGDSVLELGREVGEAWVAAGADRGRLGAPTTGEVAAGDGRGRVATFERGRVHWSPETGAHPVWDPIRDRWDAEGGAGGALGYPTEGVRATADGRGEVGRFENGAIYASAATGARVVRGPVRDFWELVGAEGSVLRLPVADVAGTGDGIGEVGRFEGGSIWWSPETGARSMQGAIGTHFANTGGATGPLGYPTRSVSWLADGVGQFATFQDGSVYWSPATGARTMMGEVGAHWLRTGGVRGPLGYPTSSVQWAPDRVGQFATFQRGSVYWSPTTGARTMMGAIGTLYSSTGGVSGSLGYPTLSVSWLADRVGQYAVFQRGGIWWKPATGAHALRGVFLTAYRNAGAERGGLGYPTRGAYGVTGGTRMDFERGTITVSSSTGRATVTLR